MQQNVISTARTNMGRDQRIAYVDAMRGYNIIILVLAHVHGFCFKIEGDIPSVVCYLGVMMLPLFFFISGFVSYRKEATWNVPQTAKQLSRKIPRLIIPAFIFLLAYTITRQQDLTENIYIDSKGGYWFTFVLFICFILYALFRMVSRLLRLKDWQEDVFATGCGLVFFVVTVSSVMEKLPVSDNLLGLLSFKHWYYFVYFIFGTLVKKHFDVFEKLLCSKMMITITLVLFFGLSMFKDAVMATQFNLYRLLTGLSGTIIVFALFWKYRSFFSKQTTTGKSLCFLGRRTLDIYFIHYFLLPRQLSDVLPVFTQHPMPVLELFASLSVSTLVIAVCLLVSTVLRLSPVLANILFGDKTHTNK